MNELNRHAYLIMAHHQFDFLKLLIEDLNQEYNDIFLHVDIKAKDFKEEELYSIATKARLIMIPRMDIHWGGYSQIQCILKLLEIAAGYGYHSYYHFMVGVEFPIKNPEYIYNFFENNLGAEFIGFDDSGRDCYQERVIYYHLFNESGRSATTLGKLKWQCMRVGVKIQKILHIKIFNEKNCVLKKGNANWSISDDLVRYILSKKEWIHRNFKHSLCGDEVFIHTLAYNNPVFREKIYDYENEYRSNMRIVQWKEKNNLYHWDDIETLLETPYLFARKFFGEEGIQIVNEIKKKRC